MATVVNNTHNVDTSVSHILFFLVDDYGFADASYKNAMYNGTAAPPTPTMDRYALAGVRLESYYVNKLCSPTRTSLLSGRYAYTNGMDNTVIVNGDNTDLPLNLLTIGDHFQRAGWNTSAYGKWDAGMTAWGSTPTCRGFDFYNGHYSAAEDHFTHEVAGGFDWHSDEKGEKKGGDAVLWGKTKSDPNHYASEIYSTIVITAAVEAWTTKQIAANPKNAKTFAYVAYQAVHGPLEVPAHYINAECEALIPASYPKRRIYCGMVRAVDESIKNITAAYEAMGILDSTLIVVSTDNGGTTSDGGNNYPLRGNKATSFEGGVRGLGFISGAGLAPAVHGTINYGIMHVTDWLPTLVTGVAGIPITTPLGRPCSTCTRAVPPLDGVDQWALLSRGEASARTEVLLDFQDGDWHSCTHHNTWPCTYPGSGALRVGKWKLLHGHQVGVQGGPTTNFCVDRTNVTVKDGKLYPLNASLKNESNKWCDFGWTPPPKADATGGDVSEHVRYPDDGSTNCTGIPCTIGNDSPYIRGDTILFDVVSDMYEEHNVAAENPEIVKQLLAKLMAYNASHCGGAHCAPVSKSNGPPGKPTKSPQPAFGSELVWLPTRGSHSPGVCDTNIYPAGPTPTPPTPTPPGPTPPSPSPPGPSSFHSNNMAGDGCHINMTNPKHPDGMLACSGWLWDSAWSGGGIPPMTVRFSLDGTSELTVVANDVKKNLPKFDGCPNTEHGFKIQSAKDWVTTLSEGKHRLDIDAFLDEKGGATGKTAPLVGTPLCFKDAVVVAC